MFKQGLSLRKTAVVAAGLLMSSSVALAESDATEKLRERANQLFKTIPSVEEVYEELELSEEQVELGRMLFFEPRLSKSQVITCNTCHSVGTGGADNVPKSLGHGWNHGRRNSPTVLNALYNGTQFWDGRAADLKEQAEGPIQDAVEMNATPEYVVEVLNSIPEYQELFAKAYADDEDPVSFANAVHAIGEFEATLVTPNAAFDKFLDGEDALSEEERNGLALFMDKGCITCHSGRNLGGQLFFKFGLVNEPSEEVRPADDMGKFELTDNDADKYSFRTSQLRNIALTAPYFHSGAVWDLQEAVTIMADTQLGQKLSDDESKAITAFLHTLTGDQPKVEYPTLPASTADTPRPDHAK